MIFTALPRATRDAWLDYALDVAREALEYDPPYAPNLAAWRFERANYIAVGGWANRFGEDPSGDVVAAFHPILRGALAYAMRDLARV